MRVRIAILGLMMGGLAACSSTGSVPAAQPSTPQTSSGANTTVGSTTQPSPSTTSAAGAPTSTTTPAAPSNGGAIVVTSPTDGQTVASPLVVTGTSKLSSVEIDLTDSAGNVLATATVAPAGGRFSATLRFAAPAQAGTLSVFVPGAGGVHNDITQVPVKLSD